jgi:trehalose 6-phosphate phosphatase/trehalose 6-phosphate synthase/phosphatase
MVDGQAELEPLVLSAARRARLDAVTSGLKDLAAGADGPWVESKPFAAVFHTRPMKDRVAAAALEARAAALGGALGAHVLPGKMVVEAAVLPAGKARALIRLKAATGADRMVFAGDDTTDELALRNIESPDLGVKVGSGPSAAALRVAGPEEMARFLTTLAGSLHETPAGPADA